MPFWSVLLGWNEAIRLWDKKKNLEGENKETLLLSKWGWREEVFAKFVTHCKLFMSCDAIPEIRYTEILLTSSAGWIRFSWPDSPSELKLLKVFVQLQARLLTLLSFNESHRSLVSRAEGLYGDHTHYTAKIWCGFWSLFHNQVNSWKGGSSVPNHSRIWSWPVSSRPKTTYCLD